jgi:hypothetical protein
MDMMRHRFCMVVLALVTGTTPGRAQAQGDTPAAKGSWHCYVNTGPAPKCRWIIITELGVEHPFLTTSTRFESSTYTGPRLDDFRRRTMTVIGLLKTRGTDRAIGVVLGYDWDRSQDLPNRMEVRYRKWRGSTAVDLGGGLAALGRGVSLSGGFDQKFVGIDARVDLVPANGRLMAAGFVGGRATSIAAPITFVTLVGLLFAAFAGSGGL